MCESWSEPRKGSGIRKVNDVSDPQWKVIGASGFVGSSIVARLNAEGISADPIEAPRYRKQNELLLELVGYYRRKLL